MDVPQHRHLSRPIIRWPVPNPRIFLSASLYVGAERRLLDSITSARHLLRTLPGIIVASFAADLDRATLRLTA